MLLHSLFRLSLVFTVALFAGRAFAAEPQVRATLSANAIGVGESVDYELTIEGGEAPQKPPVPNVDGLELRNTGQSSQLSIVNANVTRRVTLTYTFVALREGKFTFPEMEVQIDGRRLKTLPLTVTVTPGEVMKDAGDIAFARIWLEKKTLYVGEVASLELRLYLDASARWNLRNTPALNGDGFATQPLGRPDERQVQLTGKNYILASFKTVITPGKAGKLKLGPVPASLVVSRSDRGRQRFDIFGQRFGPAQEMTVTAPELEVQVKPLPVDGRPKDFSGAIGKFQFEATGSPERVKIGEPVSMKLTIKGSGNFDRIGQPPLADPAGWTTYNAKQEFSGGESASTTGIKTFELPVTPTAKHTTMPVFAFSYFDPEAEKFVTLKSAAQPLVVEGEPLTPPAAPPKGPVAEPEPAKPQPKAPAVQDILPNLPELGALSARFGLQFSPLAMAGVMFAPLPLIVVLLLWRARKQDGSAARLAELRKERAAQLARVKSSTDRAEVLDAAVKVMQFQSMLELGRNQSDWDLAAILESRRLDADSEKALRGLFEARSELLYAGSVRGGDRISEVERDRILEIVALVQKAPKK